MLNINKIEPESFKEYKRKIKPKEYSDCKDIIDKLKSELIEEQKSQCAYCEISIDSNSSHIDHIQPRNPNKNKTKGYYKLECEYSNLIASCNSKSRCGEYKKNKKFEDSFIHPIFDNAEEFFEYRGGRVFPRKDLSEIDKERVKATRDYLNLNDINLVNIRASIVDSLKYCGDYDLNELLKDFGQFETLIKDFCKKRD